MQLPSNAIEGSFDGHSSYLLSPLQLAAFSSSLRAQVYEALHAHQMKCLQ